MILVTGGTGLIGSQLLFDLAKAGNKIRALKRTTSKMHILNRVFRGHEYLLANIDWKEGDVTDLLSLEDAMQGVQQVYHCAGMVSFISADFNAMMKINSTGTSNMVNMALHAGVKNFCHVSSTAALGRTEENSIVSENTFWKTSKNNSGYAISKYSGECEVWRSIEEGLNAFIINPSIVFGPGDMHTGSTALFGEVKNGLRFYPTGSSGFVDVRDVSKCMIELMQIKSHSERFIISSSNKTYREVIDHIADCFGKARPTIRVGKTLTEIGWRLESVRKIFSKTKPLVTKETARNGQQNWFYSNEKIKRTLAIEFIPVEEGIRNTCEIFLDEARNKKHY
jgi:nucleoside-diphosphate-sugar epimerase